MSENQPLHQQIASENYWKVPHVAGEHLSLAKRVYDVVCADNVSDEIDGLARKIAQQGAHVTPLAEGAQLAVDVPGSMLKIIEDMRLYPNKNLSARLYDSPEVFDEQAQTMLDEALFDGDAVRARVAGENGSVDVGRKTLYLLNSPSEVRLAGKTSQLLGKGGGMEIVEFRERHPIGHVMNWETRRERTEARVVYASLIRPRAGRRRIIDLAEFGARLHPAPKTA